MPAAVLTFPMIFWNQRHYSSDSPELALLNRSFRYGDGLFETIRIFEGKLLLWELHIQRLLAGMAALGFEFEENAFRENLFRGISGMPQLGLPHGRLRIHVYRQGGGAFAPEVNTPGLLIEAQALAADTFSASPEPLLLADCENIALHPHALSRFKTANSLPYVLAAMEAQRKQAQDVLLFCGNYAAEASASNLFAWDGNSLLTPGLDTGCLDGCMRRHIVQLAAQLGLPCREARLDAAALLDMQELFLCNSISGIRPVTAYRHRRWDSLSLPLVQELRAALLQQARAALNIL